MFTSFNIKVYTIFNLWILLILSFNVLNYYNDFVLCDNDIKINFNSKNILFAYILMQWFMLLNLVLNFIYLWIKINKCIDRMKNINNENTPLNNYLKIELDKYLLLYNLREFTYKFIILTITLISILEYTLIFYQINIKLNNDDCSYYYSNNDSTLHILTGNIIISLFSLVIIVYNTTIYSNFTPIELINTIFRNLKYDDISNDMMNEITLKYNTIYNTNYNNNNIFISVYYL